MQVSFSFILKSTYTFFGNAANFHLLFVLFISALKGPPSNFQTPYLSLPSCNNLR